MTAQTNTLSDELVETVAWLRAFRPEATRIHKAADLIERIQEEARELALDKAELERVCKMQVEVIAELEDKVAALSADMGEDQ